MWDPCADTDGGYIPTASPPPQRTTCVCIVTMQMIDYRRAVDTQCRTILMKTSTSRRPCAAPNIAAAAPGSNRNLRLLLALLPPHPLWFWLSANLLCARAAFTLRGQRVVASRFAFGSSADVQLVWPPSSGLLLALGLILKLFGLVCLGWNGISVHFHVKTPSDLQVCITEGHWAAPARSSSEPYCNS